MDPPSSPSNIQCHPSLLPGSTPTCFLPVSPSGQVSCGRWPGWTPHSGVGTATPLSSTASAPQNKGGGGFWGTLFRISSSLHGTLWHKNNSQKSDFYRHPSCPPPPSNLIHLQLPLDPILLTRWFPPIVPRLSFQIRSGQTLTPASRPRCKLAQGFNLPKQHPFLEG